MRLSKLLRIARVRQTLLAGLCLALLLVALPVSAQFVDNGCPNAAGVPQPDCSKLSAGERITVMATECGYGTTCPATAPLVCRSIINDGGIDYFVPWKTPQEWGAFLRQLTPMNPLLPAATPLPANNLAVSLLPNVSVGACCAPQKVPDVCPEYECKPGMTGYPACSSVAAHGLPDDLGSRRVGTRTGQNGGYTAAELQHFGAQNDVYGPIKSADFFGDSTINYEVTYTCNQGAWVKSYEVGSCVPVDGACNAALPNPLPNGWTPPVDLNTLCDKAGGSTIIDSTFVDMGSFYKWECKGTPTKKTAKCDRNKFTAPAIVNGSCGPAHNGKLVAPPSTNGAKCTAGTPGPVIGLGTDASPWTWGCSGSGGGSNASCKAYLLGTPLAGICGPANGFVANNPSWTPTAAQLCNRTAAPAVPVATGNILNWTCFGENSGADAACSATLKLVNGLCGVPSTAIVTTPPHTPPIPADLPPGACSKGTPANITYDSTTKTLSWQCLGANGGSTAGCSANVDTSLIKGICKWPNGTALPAIPPATSAALCASGTADNVVTTGAVPTVGITWTCLGNKPGNDAACAVSVQIKTDAVCGTASGMTLAAKPSGAALCTVGNASAVSGGATGPIWGWTCAGLYGGLTAYCGAVYDNTSPGGSTPVNGVCAADKLVPQASKPSGTICSVGTPTAVTGSGPWNWQCKGLNGGTTASCSAPLLGAGGCGATHGTRIPNKPNANLCNTGTPSTVTGNNTTGWDWTCTGASTVSCHADPCDVCAGDLPQATRSDTVPDQTISYGSGTCQVTGTVEWSVVDRLLPGNTTYTLDLANSVTGLSYSRSQLPPTAPSNYCTPCYRLPKTISGGNFTVQRKVPGSCSTASPLDTAGNKITLPVTSSLIH